MKMSRTDVAEFLRELKRRRVYRTLVVYVVLAVGALELVDVLVPATSLPAWTGGLLLALAIIGLPAVLVLAWLFDISGGSLKRTGEATSPGPPDVAAPPDEEPSSFEPARPDGDSHVDPAVVAVLPFENLSGSPESEPLVLGLHDDLLTELSRSSALTVISRTSVRAFREEEGTPARVARELGAGTTIEGAVQTEGSRVRLNIQVTDARTGRHRWAERFDRELTAASLFDLQSELAACIITALKVELEPGRTEPRRRNHTDSMEAYRLCVRGRMRIERWSEQDLAAAAELFGRAIEVDPSYALAWSGLADAASLTRWYEFPRIAGTPTAEEAARRALELDPELAEAHLSQAIVHCSAQRTDAPAALREVERAIALQPSLAWAYIWMAWLNLLIGDPTAALEPAERSIELDPLSSPAHIFLAEVYLALGRTEAASRAAVRGREIQPAHPFANFIEALTLLHLERFEDARESLDVAERLVPPDGRAPSPGQVDAMRGVLEAARGNPDTTREILVRTDGAADPVSAGLLHAALGDIDAGFEAFERVEHWGQLSNEYLRYFFPRVLGPLRETERYQELLRRADRSWGVD